jgi:hypothetical protein
MTKPASAGFFVSEGGVCASCAKCFDDSVASASTSAANKVLMCHAPHVQPATHYRDALKNKKARRGELS